MPGTEPLDFEDIAIRHLAKRARTVHVTCGLLAAFAGIVIGQVTAWVILDTVRVLPGVVYGVLFLGPLLACLYVGRDVAKKLIAQRATRWSAELAEQYQLNAAQLRSYIDHM